MIVISPMRSLPAILFAALLATSCASPIAPDPFVEFTVVVVDNKLRRLPGETVDLVAGDSVLYRREPLRRMTNADGMVTWHVEPGPKYAARIDSQIYFGRNPVMGDTRWFAILRHRN